MRTALTISIWAFASSAFGEGHDRPYICSAPIANCEEVSAFVQNETGSWAIYVSPTTVYAHGVLGDPIEAEVLRFGVKQSAGSATSVAIVDAGPMHVFEDTNPRLFDVDRDGFDDVIAVRSNFDLGAQLIVYSGNAADTGSVMASTPYIGRRNRWLAPIGAADLDGDGTMEIAYIDRPHLAKTLRIVSIQGDQLVEEAALGGLTNHRIGERDIAGGVRDCGQGPEMIVASADWSQLIAVTYSGDFSAREIGRDTSRAAFATAMNCQ